MADNTKTDVLTTFEGILADRAGDGPSGKDYDPELLVASSELIAEVKSLRAALQNAAYELAEVADRIPYGSDERKRLDKVRGQLVETIQKTTPEYYGLKRAV